jgi:signal transduction histidine kinase
MQVDVPFGSTQERVRVSWYVAAAYLVIAVSAFWVTFGDPEIAHIVGPIGILIGDVAAGALFTARARRLEGAERRAWTLVGIGLMVAASGIAVLAIQVLAGGDPPTFGASDACFITGYVVILVGIASLPHTKGDSLQRSRIALDGIAGALSIGVLAWVLILNPILSGLEGAPLTDRVFGTLYPLTDTAVVIVVMIVTIRRSMLRFDIRLMLFSGAVLMQGLADVSYLVEGAGERFTDAEPLFVAYLAAAALFMTTAVIVDRVPKAREYADRRVPVWSMMIPYTAAVVMVVALMYRLWDTELDQADRVLLVATLTVAVLVIMRQGISIRENRVTVEQQRSDLVSSISHELRTPLTAMVGFLEVVREDSTLSKSERIEMVDIVSEQATYLERIVQDLLSLAHGDPGDMDLDLSERNIAAIVENAVLATSINRRRVDLDITPGLAAIIDGSRIQQVLVNLLSNAARYGGSQCLVVGRADGSTLVIEVHDAGPGVPKKHELTIWERFERGQNRYNAAVPGSGIGLAMVKSIAQAHGGRASYQRSNRLGGACFSIELPGRVGRQRPIAVVPSSKRAIG